MELGEGTATWPFGAPYAPRPMGAEEGTGPIYWLESLILVLRGKFHHRYTMEARETVWGASQHRIRQSRAIKD